MKLRIKDDSIRFRLNQHDFSTLNSKNEIATNTQISQKYIFKYCIKGSDQNEFAISWENLSLIISVPKNNLQAWLKSNAEGLYFSLSNGSNDLKISIERDFGCKHPDRNPKEDEYSFKNPKL